MARRIEITVLDAATAEPICDASVSLEALRAESDGGPCTYVAQMLNDDVPLFTVSRSGYKTRTIEVPTVGECHWTYPPPSMTVELEPI